MSSVFIYLKTSKELSYKEVNFILKSIVGDVFYLTWDGKFGTIILDQPDIQLVNLKLNYRTLCNDLMDDVTFVIVPRFEDILASVVKEKCGPGFYPLSKSLPQLLLDDADLYLKLVSFKNEVSEDVLETIRIYLEFNMSVNMTAKALYTHRNTINYRITRFIELTGIDIRSTLNGYYIYMLITWQDPVYNKK